MRLISRIGFRPYLSAAIPHDTAVATRTTMKADPANQPRKTQTLSRIEPNKNPFNYSIHSQIGEQKNLLHIMQNASYGKKIKMREACEFSSSGG